VAQALQSASQALALDPADAVALKVLAEIHLRKEREKRAAEAMFTPTAKIVAAPTITPAPIRSRKSPVSFSSAL
jgi:hypothetical protein